MTKKKSDCDSISRLNPCALGVAFGLLWGLSLLLTAVIASCCTWGSYFMQVMSSIYIGYGTGFLGALAGFAWGIVDGFIGGFIFGWIYNLALGCKKCCCFCLFCKCK